MADQAITDQLRAADIATLARMALEDAPQLAAKGSGPLGAGTHPAQPYLELMLRMNGVTRANVRDVTMGYDRADYVVIYFLENASGWRGEVAREVKAALRDIVKR